MSLLPRRDSPLTGELPLRTPSLEELPAVIRRIQELSVSRDLPIQIWIDFPENRGYTATEGPYCNPRVIALCKPEDRARAWVLLKELNLTG